MRDPLENYFAAIRENGDFLNDWLTHLPQAIQAGVLSAGKEMAAEAGFTPGRYADQGPWTVPAAQPDRMRASTTGGGGGITLHVHNDFSGAQIGGGYTLDQIAQAATSGTQRGLRQGYGPGRVR